TIWNSVPALMKLWVEYVEVAAETKRRRDVLLRAALLSGDWIPVHLPDRVKACAPGCTVWSLGGATEASIWSIAHVVHHVDPEWPSIPYGRALPGQTVEVLDAELERCPEWVTGELYIGGVGLARGYLHDEEKTRAKFVRHPHTAQRLYRTGDLGRYR